MRKSGDSANTNRLMDSEFVKHEHPNLFLRVYGDTMSAIASFFLKLAMPYMTTYEMIIDWDDEEDDLEDDTV